MPELLVTHPSHGILELSAAPMFKFGGVNCANADAKQKRNAKKSRCFIEITPYVC
jgi:hypothetical protein